MLRAVEASCRLVIDTGAVPACRMGSIDGTFGAASATRPQLGFFSSRSSLRSIASMSQTAAISWSFCL
jgi:hypothetical protein